MAATIAVLGTSVFNTTAGNKTITATPTVGDLIVVITSSTGVATSLADNGTGGTYTQVDSTRTGFSTTGNLQMWVRNSLVSSATSTTYTATQTSSTGGGLVILRVTGMSLTGASAVRSSGGQSSGTASTTPAPVLSSTPLSSNPIITAVSNGATAASITPRTGYTEDFDNGYSTPSTGLEVSHLASGETSATITYGATSATAFASIAIELNVLPVIAQSSFRLYEDGTESGSTAIAAQDTGITRDVTSDSNLALRLRVQESNGADGLSTDDYQLQYSSNSGTYTNVGTGLGVVSTYYFDASDAAATDPNAAWTSDANAFDGSTATSAQVTVVGTTSSNYLMAEGTNAPTTGNTITQVRARNYAGRTGTTGLVNSAIYTDGLAELLGTAQNGSATGTPNYSSYVTLTTPSGGWTWQKVNDLEVKSYGSTGVSFTSGNIYRIEVEVTSTGATQVTGYNSANLTDATATTNRLGAGSGSFVAGLISEDGLVDNHTLTASNYTEHLYSLTVVSAAVADTDTLDFRVLRNAAVIDTYSVTPRITVSKSSGTSTTVTQVAATVTASGGTQVIASTSNAAITQVAGAVTATGGTEVIAGTVIASASIAQSAATVTASGGVQTIATINNVAISQIAASVTAAGGTQASATINNVAITQSAATVTASGGTQTVVSKINTSVTQVAATVTATGSTQVIASVQSISITQVAGSVTASGGTQAPATVNNVSISQTAGTVTASGGTQTNTAVQSTSITQLAGSVTASGGTEVVASVQNQAISQVAGSVTATGGTEVITTVNNVAISQSAATVTASGGTDSVSAAISTSVTQVAGSVIATGGTETVTTVRIVALTQVAGVVTASGGTQASVSVQNVSITQVSGSVIASGGTQSTSGLQSSAITQVAGNVTANGGTQSLTAMIDSVIAQQAGTVTATGGTQGTVAQSLQSISLAQIAATVTASGGVQVIATANYAVIERSSSLTLVVPEPISLTLQQQVSAISGKQPTVTSLVYTQPSAIELTLAQRATSLTLVQQPTELTANLGSSSSLVARL